MSDTLTYKDIYEQFNRSRVVKVANDPDYTGDSITSGVLQVGVRYEFITVGTGADFTNVGCDADPVAGDYFYATANLAPTVYGIGTAIYAGMSPQDVVENEIANCRVEFNAIAEYCDAVFSEGGSSTQMAMKYYTMFLLYLRAQNEKQGEGEYKTAYSMLIKLYGSRVIDYFNGVRRDEQIKASTQKICEVSNIDWNADDYDEIFADDKE